MKNEIEWIAEGRGEGEGSGQERGWGLILTPKAGASRSMETVLSSLMGVASRDTVDSGVKTLSCEMLSDVVVATAARWLLSLKRNIMNERTVPYECYLGSLESTLQAVHNVLVHDSITQPRSKSRKFVT